MGELLTISGGSYASVDLTKYDGVVITGGATVTSWLGVDSAKTLEIRNDATLETAQWNTNLQVTIDLQGTTATTAYKLVKAIDYTGAGTVTYGVVNLINGSTAAGGYVFDNDLTVGDCFYYNNTDWDDVTGTQTIAINGATFAVNNWGNEDQQTALSAYAAKHKDQIFVITGSTYYVASQNETNSSFWQPTFIYNAEYVGTKDGDRYTCLHLLKDSDDYTGQVTNAIIQGSTFRNDAHSGQGYFYIEHHINNFGELNVTVVGSTFDYQNGSRAFIQTTGDYTLTFRDNTSYSSQYTAVTSADPTYIAGSIVMTVDHCYVGNVYSGNANAHSGTICQDSHTIILNGSTVSGGVYAASRTYVNSGKNVFQWTKGNAIVDVTNAKVTNIYASETDKTYVTPETEEKPSVTYVGTAKIDGKVIVNLSGATITGSITPAEGGTIGQGIVINLSASSVATIYTPATAATILENGMEINALTGTSSIVAIDAADRQALDRISVSADAELAVKCAFSVTDLTLGANGKLTATGAVTATNTNIAVNVADETITKVIDSVEGADYGNLTVSGTGTASVNSSGDVIAYNADVQRSQLYLNTAWEGYTFGQAITVDGVEVYYGINAFSSFDDANAKAADNASLTITGGSFATLDGKFSTVTFLGASCTVDAWDADGQTLNFKNRATVTTGAWNTKNTVSVDGSYCGTNPEHVNKVISYTGSGSVAFGEVTIAGASAYGGFVVDNTLYAGKVIYVSEDLTGEETNVVINGATFALNFNATTGNAFVSTGGAFLQSKSSGLSSAGGYVVTWGTLTGGEVDLYDNVVLYNVTGKTGTPHVSSNNSNNTSHETWVIGGQYKELVGPQNRANGNQDTIIHIENAYAATWRFFRRSNTLPQNYELYVTGSSFGQMITNSGNPGCVNGDFIISIKDTTVNSQIHYTMGCNAGKTDYHINGDVVFSLDNTKVGTDVYLGFYMQVAESGSIAQGTYKWYDILYDIKGDRGIVATFDGATVGGNVYMSGRRDVVTVSIGHSNIAHDANLTMTDSYVGGTVYMADASAVGGTIGLTMSGSSVHALATKNEEGSFTATEAGLFLTVAAGQNTIDTYTDTADHRLYSVTIDNNANLAIGAGALTVTELNLGTNSSLSSAAAITATNTNITIGSHNLSGIHTDVASNFGTITVTGGTFVQLGNNLIAYDMTGLDALYVNSNYTGTLGDAITLQDGTVVYYGINAFSSITEAAAHASSGAALTVTGGTIETASLMGGTFGSLTFSGNTTTVGSWDASVKAITLKQDAKLVTGEWGGAAITVDLAGSTATDAYKLVKAIDYTGDGTVTYGAVTLINGGTAAGGYAFDNDLTVGNCFYYNNTDWDDVTGTQTIAINGATFAVNNWGNEDQQTKLTAYAKQHQDQFFVITGSTYFIESSNEENSSFRQPTFIYNAEYVGTKEVVGTRTYYTCLHLFKDSANYAEQEANAIIQGSTFRNIALSDQGYFYVDHGVTNFGTVNVTVVGSTFNFQDGSRSNIQTTGDYTLTFRDNFSDTSNSQYAAITSAGSPYIGGSIVMTVDHCNVNNVYSGNANAYSGTIGQDSHTVILNGSTVRGTVYAASRTYVGSKSDMLQWTKGNVIVDVTDAKVANIYAAEADKTSGTYVGTSKIDGKIIVNLDGATITGSITPAEGGTVGQGIVINLSGSSVAKIQTPATAATILANGMEINVLAGTSSIGSLDTAKRQALDRITIKADSTLQIVNAIAFTGTITIDGTGFEGGKNCVLDVADGSTYAYYAWKGGEAPKGVELYQSNGDLYVKRISDNLVSYVNSTWSGKSTEEAITLGDKTVYYGLNAFSDVATAETKTAATGTVALAGGSFNAVSTEKALSVVADTTVTGSLSAASITIDAGATLTYSGPALTVVNNGTLNVDASYTVSGYSFIDYTITGEGTLTAYNGGFVEGKRVYNYCVVDSNITSTTTSVVINGVATSVVYGVNAFKSTADAKAAHTGANLVVLNETISGGTLGGGTNVLTSGTTITGNLYGASAGTVSSVDLTLNGASSSATVLGGGSSLASSVSGDIALTLTDATVDRIVYGGGQSGSVGGSITTTVSGNSKIGKNFYGGSLISSKTCGAYTAGAVNVNISGGSFGGHVVGGSRLNGSSVTASTLSQTVASVTLDISGGTFDNKASLFAGGYVVGNGETPDHTDLVISNGVTMTLNADVVTANAASGIYGGALASSMGVANVGGGVSITVTGGHYSNIWGGGWAESKATSSVSGGVTINVTGGSIGNIFAGGNNDTSGAKANVVGSAVITLSGCTVNNVYASSKYGTSKITGSSKVTVGSDVTITGKLSGFNYSGKDSVVAGTEKGADGKQTLDLNGSVSCSQVLGFDVWEVASGATLTSDNAIDLEDVTLKLDAAAWTVASGSAISNLADADGVTIGGVTADKVLEEEKFAYWSATVGDDTWKLSVEDNTTLKLAKISKLA